MIKLAQILALCASTCAAIPSAAQPVPPWAYRGAPRFAHYGYGPRPYGFRPYYFRRSYGTGYNGRGTATGGPVGGLPSRN